MRRKITILAFIMIFVLTTVGCQSAKLTPFETNQRWGYKDASGKVIIGPHYLLAEPFNKYDIAPVVDPDRNAWIYIDNQGRFVIQPFIYDNGCDYFSEGLARFEERGKIGFFNERGQKVVPAAFEFAYPFKNGYSVVAKGVRIVPDKDGEHNRIQADQYGFIDRKGRLAIPYKFDGVVSAFEDPKYAVVIMDGKNVRIDREGKIIGEHRHSVEGRQQQKR